MIQKRFNTFLFLLIVVSVGFGISSYWMVGLNF